MKDKSILNDPLVNSSNCDVPCFCGCCELDEYYQCAGCLRTVAYCFGASDKWYEYCDDCTFHLNRGVAPQHLYSIIHKNNLL